MNQGELDRRVELAEKKVLVLQNRVLTERDKVNNLIHKLDSEATDLLEMKKEWMKKRNNEEERRKQMCEQLLTTHRHDMEDLRVKYEAERQDKLREVRIMISEKEADIEEWRRKRDESVMKTKTEESKLKAKFQEKISQIMRAETASQRRGIVDRSRLLSATGSNNPFSMDITGFHRNTNLGLKRSRAV